MNLSRINVVVADDNIEFRNILCEYLSIHVNINIIGVASDGLEAIQIIQEKKPDLVILDILMPNLDGLSVLTEFSKMNLNPKPKVIILSTAGSDVVIKKAISLGADYYIIKPFDMGVLYEKILQVCSSSSSKDELKEKAAELEIQKNIPVSINILSIEQQIRNIIEEAGIPAHVKGYKFIKEAVNLFYIDMESLSLSDAEIYLSVAKKFNTTQSRIERAMRYAIEYSYLDGKVGIINKMISLADKKNKVIPTTAEFIKLLIDRLI